MLCLLASVPKWTLGFLKFWTSLHEFKAIWRTLRKAERDGQHTKIFLHLWCMSRVSRSIFWSTWSTSIILFISKQTPATPPNICCGFCWPNSFVWLLHHLNPQTLDSFGTHDIKSLEVPLRQKGWNTYIQILYVWWYVCVLASTQKYNIFYEVVWVVSSASFFRRVGSILTWHSRD